MREVCPDVVKYWPKESQMLGQVRMEDRRIAKFPQKILDEVGEEIGNNVVIFSAFGGKNDSMWSFNTYQGQRLIVELQNKFPSYHGGGRKINYVVKKVPGFKKDNELFM